MSQSFKVKHEITKNINGFTNRHFFLVEERIQGPFVAYIGFEGKLSEVKVRLMVDKVQKEQFVLNGGRSCVYFDTIEEEGVPEVYKFEVKYGVIGQHKSVFEVKSSGKYEDVLKSAEELLKKMKGEK